MFFDVLFFNIIQTSDQKFQSPTVKLKNLIMHRGTKSNQETVQEKRSIVATAPLRPLVKTQA